MKRGKFWQQKHKVEEVAKKVELLYVIEINLLLV